MPPALPLHPVPLAEPFGDDVFHPLHHRHALVQGRGVGAAVGAHVVPREQQPARRRHADARLGKPRRPALLDIVQVDHRGPCPLAAALAHLGPVAFAFVEVVMMHAELLARRIALTLHRLTLIGFDAERRRDRLVDRLHLGRPARHVAAFGGTERGIAAIGEQRRWPAVGVDHRDQRCALVAREIVARGISLHRRHLQPLEPRVAVKPRRDLATDPGTKRGGLAGARRSLGTGFEERHPCNPCRLRGARQAPGALHRRAGREVHLPEDVVDRVDDLAGIQIDEQRVVVVAHPAIRAICLRQAVVVRIVDPVALREQDRRQPEPDREAAIAIVPAVRRIIARQVERAAIARPVAVPVIAIVLPPAAIPVAAAIARPARIALPAAIIPAAIVGPVAAVAIPVAAVVAAILVAGIVAPVGIAAIPAALHLLALLLLALLPDAARVLLIGAVAVLERRAIVAPLAAPRLPIALALLAIVAALTGLLLSLRLSLDPSLGRRLLHGLRTGPVAALDVGATFHPLRAHAHVCARLLRALHPFGASTAVAARPAPVAVILLRVRDRRHQRRGRKQRCHNRLQHDPDPVSCRRTSRPYDSHALPDSR
ncbi:membrane hypothetical protein [Sphingomonas sp. EC-HK361]|nr:membrane hypothetical protein [Sphingomonas sp. EC-HK361]